ncbi:MAG: hypothetical protein H6719_21905 [Sandaracinaceae bacterium]|nr:hypothetical protein [Sandaracinaceae bacterium]
MDWLEHDEADPASLPKWAQAASEVHRAKGLEVRVGAEGVVLARGRRASAVRWEDVLVLVRLGARQLLLSAARRPPLPPWFEIVGPAVDTIERTLRTRLDAIDHRGYREVRRRRVHIPADQVLASVLAHEPLPGAVEIPGASLGVFRSAAIGATVGGGVLAFYGMFFGPVGMAIAAGVGLVGGGSLLGGIEHARQRKAGRVLVLTPDAFVGGLDGESVRAVSWGDVGEFVAGVDPLGSPALEVRGPSGDVLARTPARYFARSLDVIVAVAEAYRRRHSPE